MSDSKGRKDLRLEAAAAGPGTCKRNKRAGQLDGTQQIRASYSFLVQGRAGSDVRLLETSRLLLAMPNSLSLVGRDFPMSPLDSQLGPEPCLSLFLSQCLIGVTTLVRPGLAGNREPLSSRSQGIPCPVKAEQEQVTPLRRRAIIHYSLSTVGRPRRECPEQAR